MPPTPVPSPGPSGERPDTLQVTYAEVTVFIQALVWVMSGVREDPAGCEVMVIKAAAILLKRMNDEFLSMYEHLLKASQHISPL